MVTMDERREAFLLLNCFLCRSRRWVLVVAWISLWFFVMTSRSLTFCSLTILPLYLCFAMVFVEGRMSGNGLSSELPKSFLK